MIDTHAHLFLSQQAEADFVAQAEQAGVTGIINVATNLENAGIAARTAQQFSMVFSTVGIHPCENTRVVFPDEFREFVAKHPVVAIGEIGLDGYRSPVDDNQIERFITQLDLAAELDLPVIIHCRQAAEKLTPIMNRYPYLTKVYHCFSEDQAFIDAVMDSNTYFSFTGNVTYSNAGNSRHAAAILPIDRIMLETDSPYLVPSKFKGTPNQSAYVGEVARTIAELRGISKEEVIAATTANASRFFRLNER